MSTLIELSSRPPVGRRLITILMERDCCCSDSSGRMALTGGGREREGGEMERWRGRPCREKGSEGDTARGGLPRTGEKAKTEKEQMNFWFDHNTAGFFLFFF